MLSIYSSYKCNYCKKDFVLLTENIESVKEHLVCPYCSSRNVRKQGIADNLKECMQEKAYKRVHGSIRQVR